MFLFQVTWSEWPEIIGTDSTKAGTTGQTGSDFIRSTRPKSKSGSSISRLIRKSPKPETCDQTYEKKTRLMRLGWKSTGLPRLDSREKCFSFKQIHRDPKITLLSFNLRHNFSSDLSYQKFPLKSFCQIFQPTSEALRPSCSWCER